MGNASSAQDKSSTSNQNTGQPDWAQVGSDAYNNLNSFLQTGPMAAAAQTISQGGIGQASQNAIDNLQNMGGSNPWMDQAANEFQNVGQIGEGTYRDMIGQAGQPGAAEQYLTSTAQGDYLGGSPYLDDIISRGAQDIGDQTAQMFAAGGRYGSGAHQGIVSDSVARYGNELRNANYQAERDRQMGAANAIEAAQQGRTGLGLQGAAGLAGVQGQNIGNQLGAAGQLANLGMGQFSNQLQSQLGAAGLENQGIQNMLGMISQLPTIQGNKVFDAQQQMGIGGQIDQRAQQGLQDLINQWTQGDMEEWARLGGLLSAGLGSAGSYGTQTQTQPGNPFGGLGLLGSILTAPVSGGGSIIGNAFSDRRMKENIERVGEYNGIPVYEFNYLYQPERWRGVMADEARSIVPDAVHEGPGGYLVVDYSKLGMPMERV